MKILRFYWSPSREHSLNDLVLSVVRETKTQLVAIDRRNPSAEYRFRKPKNLQSGVAIYRVGKQESFSPFTYKLWLE